MILRLEHERPDGEIDAYFLKPGRRYHIGRGSACEIRILDLKLSRKHCALECTDNQWQVIDLLSTNGCDLDGTQIVGTIPVKKGQVISAGSTQLTIAEVMHAEAAPVQGTRRPVAEMPEAETDTEALTPDSEAIAFEQEPMPEGPNDHAAKTEALRRNHFDPEPVPASLRKTDALIPIAPIPSTSRLKKEPIAPVIINANGDLNIDTKNDIETGPFSSSPDEQKTAAPVTATLHKAPPTASTTSIIHGGTDATERPLFITVLGRRIGPLSRAVARDLKARELKGTLTAAELEQFPVA
jgi:Inner membrane component of T3SS, cytoplasmic domain